MKEIVFKTAVIIAVVVAGGYVILFPISHDSSTGINYSAAAPAFIPTMKINVAYR